MLVLVFSLIAVASAWPWMGKVMGEDAKRAHENMKGSFASAAERVKKVTDSLTYSPTYTGEAWQSLPAAQKFAVLNRQIKADQTPQPWYSSVRILEILTENLGLTFSHVGDDMPAQLLGLEERPKVIHTVGAVATVQLRITQNPCGYTGIFASGSDTAYLRFSLASQPEATGGIVPGISLKFLRDGIPSANVMLMYSLAGQESYNFFKHDLTNHPPNADFGLGGEALKLLADAFAKVSKFPTMLGLSALANATSNGTVAENPKFPFRLIVQPSAALRTAFPDAPPNPFDPDFYVSQISTLTPGSLVYILYAVPNPPSAKVAAAHLNVAKPSADADVCSGSDPIPIGQFFVSGTPPSGSYYGDHDLFFEHVMMEDDLALQPAFKAPAEAILAEQGKNWPPVPFPDLPQQD